MLFKRVSDSPLCVRERITAKGEEDTLECLDGKAVYL